MSSDSEEIDLDADWSSLMSGKRDTVQSRDVKHDADQFLENLLREAELKQKRLKYVEEEEADKANDRVSILLSGGGEDGDSSHALQQQQLQKERILLSMEMNGPPPFAWLPSPNPAETMSVPTNSVHEEQVLAVFIGKTRAESSASFDQLLGRKYASCWGGSVIPITSRTNVPRIILSKDFVVALFAMLSQTQLEEESLKRGLCALRFCVCEDLPNTGLVLEALKFACYAPSRRCEVEIAKLVACQDAELDWNKICKDLFAHVMVENSPANMNLLRFHRIAKLFTCNLVALRAFVEEFKGQRQFWSIAPTTTSDALARVLWTEVNASGKQTAQDFHRWYALVSVIEMELRWSSSAEEREAVLDQLAKISTRLDKQFIFPYFYLHTLLQTVRKC